MIHPANPVNHCLLAHIAAVKFRLQGITGALVFFRLCFQCLFMGLDQGFLFFRPIRLFLIITAAPAGIGIFQCRPVFFGALRLCFLMFLNALIMACIELIIILL